MSLDVEMGSVDDHRDVIAVLREVLAGMAAAVGEGAPDVPAEIPVIYLRDSLALLGAPADEPSAHSPAGRWGRTRRT